MEEINFNLLSVKELKKRIEEKEKSLKSKFKNPLDKFTDIDDLLRQMIEEQHISNQLLLHILFKKDSDGFIAPYQSNGDILERLKVSGDDYKTIVKHIANMKVSGSSKIFEVDGSGIVGEIMFKSSNATVNNKVYGVRIMSDNSIAYKDTWNNFLNKSFHEVDISCWEDLVRNYYLLVIQKIAFAKNLIIEVYGSTTHFTDIYIKYHLKV